MRSASLYQRWREEADRLRIPPSYRFLFIYGTDRDRNWVCRELATLLPEQFAALIPRALRRASPRLQPPRATA
jgi:hypothetical protein